MFPKEVLTKSKKGKVEARSLKDKGEFIRYDYLDPETGEKTEKKTKLVLKEEGEVKEKYFIIPLKKEKSLLISLEPKSKRKIWNPEKEKAIEI